MIANYPLPITHYTFTMEAAKTQVIYDTIIIGGGPAGMSAAVYVGRKKLKTLILSKDLGGQTAQSSDIENYLGFHLISGAELAAKFQEHLKDFDIDLKVGETVKSIKGQAPQFIVSTTGGDYHGQTVIIASGKLPRLLNIPGETEYIGKGVTYCATCDAPLFNNKEVAVIGGGNAALDAVLQLERIAKKIYLININKEFGSSADRVMLDKVSKSSKVEIIFNATSKLIKGGQTVNGLTIEDATTGQLRELIIQGIFIEIGSLPSVSFLPQVIKKNKWNEIMIDANNMTVVEGIFAAGDVTQVREKQSIIAAGEGAKAALSVADFLARNHFAEIKSDVY